MKIALALLGCTAMALLVTAAPPHHASVPSTPHKTSAALADAMRSHGIELADVEASAPAAGYTPVVYSPAGTQ
jgi:hypothetical protein